MIDPTRRALLTALAAGLAAPAWSMPPLSRPPTPRPSSQAPDGAALASRAALSGAVGFVVVDLATGAVLEGLAADRPFAPASVAKIPTALFALETLGAARRFATTVRADGPIEGGRLSGSLALAGGGDPELDSAELARLARAAAAGVRAVDGRFVVDGGAVASLIDPSQRPEASYNPAVAGLNLNYNRVQLAWSRRGQRLEAGLRAHAEGYSPAVSTIGLDLAGEDCGCPPFDHVSGPDLERWRVRAGAMQGQGSVWLPVRAPDRYAGEVFRLAASDAGLILPAPTPGAAAGVEVARHESRPLAEIARDMLRWSTNLTAEALGRAACAALGRPETELAASAAVMSDWVATRAGFPADAEFRLVNHSGLDPTPTCSPRRMAALLVAAQGTLAELLPLRRMDPAEGTWPEGARVAAKTGTIDFGRGLAGYIEGPSGRRLAFAYFANDLDRRVAGRSQQAARAWRNRATALERDLLRSWAVRFG